MADKDKQSRENKSIRKGLLIGSIIVLIILISYFTLTDIPLLDSYSLNKTLLKKKLTGNSYNWENLLLILTGAALLSILYLAVTNRLSKVSRKLAAIYTTFTNQIKLSEGVINIFIIPGTVIALFIVIKGLSYNCCDWWTILFARLSSPIEPLNFRNVLIGIAGVATLVFAGWRTYIAGQQKEDQVKRTEMESDRRLSERFDGAVAALSKKLDESSFPSHLGAISSLRTLAIDSSEYTQRCLDIICSCNHWMEDYIDEFINKKDSEPYSSWLLKEDNRIANKNIVDKITLLHEKRSQEALVAVSDILENISIHNPKQLKALDFRNKILCGINLDNLTLDGINFENTYLVAASLKKTSLKKASLKGTNLHRVSLSQANLHRASLDKVNLHGALLFMVDLEGAHLHDTNLHGALIFESTFFEASLNHVNLQGAYLSETNLQRASLNNANIQGAFLNIVNLQEALLFNTKFQGTEMNRVNLSYALALDCNLYGTTLKDITSENIIFNNIVKIDYIKDEEERKQYLDNVCKYLNPDHTQSFIQRMEAAWQAMDNTQEPAGLETIRKDSILFEDNQGMYDIRENDLTDLQKRWQKLVNEKDMKFLISLNGTISLLDMSLRWQAGQTTNKNVKLFNKLQGLYEKSN